MAIVLKHAFQLTKGDGVDSTLVQPSNWNAQHTFTMAKGNILGRTSVSDGDVTEIPLSFDNSNNATFPANVSIAGSLTVNGQTTEGVPTGMRGGFLGTTAQVPGGWALLNGGSIGDALSGANYASTASENLFKLMWPNTNWVLQDSTGAAKARGASAQADWDAHCRIVLPNYNTRFIRVRTDGAAPGLKGGADGHSHNSVVVYGSGTTQGSNGFPTRTSSGAGSDNGFTAGNHTHNYGNNSYGYTEYVDHKPSYIEEVAMVKF